MAKIGAGHAAAMARQGLAELRQALSFGANSVEQPAGPGIYGTATQLEVNQTRGNAGNDTEQEAPAKLSMADFQKIAQEKAKEAHERMGHTQQRSLEGQER